MDNREIVEEFIRSLGITSVHNDTEWCDDSFDYVPEENARTLVLRDRSEEHGGSEARERESGGEGISDLRYEYEEVKTGRAFARIFSLIRSMIRRAKP